MSSLLLLAVGLAMDATAAAAGMGARARSLRPVLLAALLFGLFQSGMSGLGWLGGVAVARVAAAWDHWIAFLLLGGIGINMLREAWSGEDTEAGEKAESLGAVLLLAVATSVDALAAGLTLPMLGLGAPLTLGLIGVVTALLSGIGGLVGRALGDRFGSRLELLGGVVLIGLGFKILIQHLAAGG